MNMPNTPRLMILSSQDIVARLFACMAVLFASIVLNFAVVSPSQAQLSGYTNDYTASTDQLIRPCFGALINARICHGRTFKPRGHMYGYGRLRSNAYINCDRESSSSIEAKISRVRSGGAVHFSGRRCRVSLNLNRSLVLIGSGSGNEATQIIARDGESCVRVNPSAQKVFIENLVLIASRAGQSACIYSSNAELTLKNVSVRYEGDSAAVNVYGGRLNLINSNIVARTRYVALMANNVQMFAESSVIASTSNGMMANLNGDSSLQGMSILQLGDWRGFERGESARGVEIKLDSSQSILTLDDMRVSDFSDGIHISGAGEALLSRISIEGASHGILSSLGRVRIINNVIKADEVGISVFGGTAYIGYNRIALVRTAGLLAEDKGEIRAVDNKIDVDPNGCTKLKWGSIDPAQRTCTPWYKGSEFDTPADSDLPMYQGFWPSNMSLAVAAKPAKAVATSATGTKVQDPVT